MSGPWMAYQAQASNEAEAAPTGPWSSFSAPAPKGASNEASNETSAETARLARSGDSNTYKPNQSKAEEQRLARNNRKVYQGTVQGAADKNHADFGRGLGDTLAFGFRDEIAAKYNELMNDVPYDYALAQQQALDAEGEGTGARLMGQVVGGIATSLIPVGAAARGAGLVGKAASPFIGGAAARFLPTVGAGAIGGGLYGAGSAEEDNRLEGAVEGAAIGGVLGGAVQQVAKAGTAGYRAYQGAQKAPALPVGSFNPKTVAAVLKGNDEAISLITNEGYAGAKQALNLLEEGLASKLETATTAAQIKAANSEYLAGVSKVKQATRAFTKDGQPLEGEALAEARKNTEQFFDSHKADILRNAVNTQTTFTKTGTAIGKDGTKKSVYRQGEKISSEDLKPMIEKLQQSPQWGLFTPAEQAVLKGAAAGSKGFLERMSRQSPATSALFNILNHPLGMAAHAVVNPLTAAAQGVGRVYAKANTAGSVASVRGLENRLKKGAGSEVPHLLSQGNISTAVASNPAFNEEAYRGLFGGEDPQQQQAQYREIQRQAQEAQLTEERRKAASGS